LDTSERVVDDINNFESRNSKYPNGVEEPAFGIHSHRGKAYLSKKRNS